MCHLNFLSLADVDFESPDDSPLRSKSLPDCAHYRHNLDAQKHVFVEQKYKNKPGSYYAGD